MPLTSPERLDDSLASMFFFPRRRQDHSHTSSGNKQPRNYNNLGLWCNGSDPVAITTAPTPQTLTFVTVTMPLCSCVQCPPEETCITENVHINSVSSTRCRTSSCTAHSSIQIKIGCRRMMLPIFNPRHRRDSSLTTLRRVTFL